MNIPLFKKVFEKYSDTGLPKKEELIRFLESEYKINPTYAPSVAKTLFDSIQKYFREYGKKYISAKIEERLEATKFSNRGKDNNHN